MGNKPGIHGLCIPVDSFDLRCESVTSGVVSLNLYVHICSYVCLCCMDKIVYLCYIQSVINMSAHFMEFCACTTTNWNHLVCGASIYGKQWIKFPCLASGFCHHFIATSKHM